MTRQIQKLAHSLSQCKQVWSCGFYASPIELVWSTYHQVCKVADEKDGEVAATPGRLFD
jgi:hypothetical protein